MRVGASARSGLATAFRALVLAASTPLRSRASLLATVVALGSCSPSPEVLRFAAMGDMGTGGQGQRRVADVLADRAREEPLDFWLALGDNIYPWGVLSPEDSLWEQKFEDVYDDPALQVPVYGTLGNHDYLGLPLAQVRRSELSDTWTMPDRYYAFSRFLADGTEVALFALDTEMILSSIRGDIEDTPLEERLAKVRQVLGRAEIELSDELARYIAERINVEDGWAVMRIAIYAERTGGEPDRELVDEVLEGSGTPDFTSQLEWLREGLAESDARWKIVFGHQPIYSHNPWREASPEYLERVEPVLVEGGVDVYLAGHDHFLDMMKPVHGIHHVTSGGGSGDDEPYEFVETDESDYVATGGGLTLFLVTRDEMVIEFVDSGGTTRYTKVLAK